MNLMRKTHVILIGLAIIILFIFVAGPINAAILGLIIGTALLIYTAIFMLSGIVGYFEKEESYIKFAWAPEPFVFNKRDLIKAIFGFCLSIAGLIVLWTVVARHPLLYPHLKSLGII